MQPTPVPAGPGGVTVTWNPVYGALGYDVRYRLSGVTDWTETATGVSRYDTTWTNAGYYWEYQVRTNNGTHGDHLLLSPWSPVVGAVATPETVGAPPGIVTRATATGVDWEELAERETELFREDMTALRVLAPDHYVGAVEAIPLVV